MRLNKLFMGLALGVTLAAGTASTAEAKAKPVVVTVDKADASTAKKVDTAFKKGKAVTLKVKGTKKTSKKLLIKLQGVIADTMRYGVCIDLDDGNRDCEGKGNKFHTYKDLDYKQSGNYGCYTFSKSTCNAYKYAFKFIKGNVDKCINPANIKKAYANYKSSFEEEYSGGEHGIEDFERAITSIFQDIIDSKWYNINDVTYKFFDDFISMYPKERLGEVAEGSVDKLIEDALANGVVEDVVKELVEQAELHDFWESKPELMTMDEWGKDSETYNFYKGGSLKVDFSRELSLAVLAIYLGDEHDKRSAMVYGGLKGVPEFDATRKMKAYELQEGTDEFRFKSLVNKTAHGVCADFACVNRALIDYLGYRSYYVANMKADHAVCALNYKGVLVTINNERFEAYYSSFSKPFDSEAVPYDEEETIQNFEDDWNMAKNGGWEQCFKNAMGDDYPF